MNTRDLISGSLDTVKQQVKAMASTVASARPADLRQKLAEMNTADLVAGLSHVKDQAAAAVSTREGAVKASIAAMMQTLGDAGLGFDMDGAGRFLSPLWETIKAKAAALARKADELVPPETLEQWLCVGITVVLPALVLLCLARCCARGRGGHMMVAPGRRGARMPRGPFEANPRGYFRDLRANKPLVFFH